MVIFPVILKSSLSLLCFFKSETSTVIKKNSRAFIENKVLR